MSELPSEVQLVAEIERLRAALATREQEAAEKERQLERYAADLRETFKRERARSLELEARSLELSRSYTATVRALSNAVEFRDAYTGRHAERVTAYGLVIARRLDLHMAERPEMSQAIVAELVRRMRGMLEKANDGRPSLSNVPER